MSWLYDSLLCMESTVNFNAVTYIPEQKVLQINEKKASLDRVITKGFFFCIGARASVFIV